MNTEILSIHRSEYPELELGWPISAGLVGLARISTYFFST